MTAPTKSWTDIADATIAAGKPIDQNLMTALRDNLAHLEEWLGKDFAAAQNHNHDGVNSAALEIGPNWLRNGNFENALTGWTATQYTGGTVTTGSSNETEATSGLVITSTVAANGGGNVISNEFIGVPGGEYRQFTMTIKGSAASVPIKAEAIWYDDTQAQISADTIINTQMAAGVTATMTIASPAVVTVTSHGLSDGAPVIFTTTGALPTGVVAGTVYYVGNAATNTFNLYDTHANAIAAGTTGRVNTSGSQSGTHTMYASTISPVVSRLVVRRIAAPATARYVKVKLELPAGGVSAGTIYFDAVVVSLPAFGHDFWITSNQNCPVLGDVVVEIASGAGGGGGGYEGGGAGGGGGAGAWAWGRFTINGETAITIGSGGNGGDGGTLSPGNGTAGAATSFGALMSCSGGARGNAGTSGAAGAAGAQGTPVGGEVMSSSTFGLWEERKHPYGGDGGGNGATNYSGGIGSANIFSAVTPRGGNTAGSGGRGGFCRVRA